MEPGRRYASEYGKLCGTLETVGVNGVYNLCVYAQISNDKLQKMLKTEIHYLCYLPMFKLYKM